MSLVSPMTMRVVPGLCWPRDGKPWIAQPERLTNARLINSTAVLAKRWRASKTARFGAKALKAACIRLGLLRLCVDVTIRLPDNIDRISLFGPAERNLKVLREALGVRVAARDGVVQLSGDRGSVTVARGVLDRLATAATLGKSPSRQQVLDMIVETARQAETGQIPVAQTLDPVAWDGRLNVYAAGRPVAPKTENQRRYLEAIRTHDLVFAMGPAGTGKTYLAVAAAVHLLKIEAVRKLVLVRPAVEAGEKLGFLPGDMREKVNPYLRPLLDALHDMMDFNTIRRFLDSDVIEISPLAFMRGRTLNGSIVILDEAQNSTKGQMKMFLTRLGHGSKMIVTGDSTQTDLEDPKDNGLVDAALRLSKTRGVAFVHLQTSDVVRHDLVQRVIEAYEDSSHTTYSSGQQAGTSRRPRRGFGAGNNEVAAETVSGERVGAEPVAGDQAESSGKSNGELPKTESQANPKA